MLKNFTIRARIIAALALILCATVALGLFAIQRLSEVDAAASDISSNWLPSANVLGDLSQDFEQLRARQGQFMLAPIEKKPGLAEKIVESETELSADLKAYRPHVTKGVEEDFAKAIDQYVGEYVKSSGPLMAKVNAGDMVGAVDMYFGEMQDSADQGRKAIRDDRAYQLKMGKQAADVGTALGKSAITLIMAALALTSIACFIVGFIMVRTISMPITHMSGVMRALADGDTKVTVPNVGERNEIGKMATAVEVFKDNMIQNRALE